MRRVSPGRPTITATSLYAYMPESKWLRFISGRVKTTTLPVSVQGSHRSCTSRRCDLEITLDGPPITKRVACVTRVPIYVDIIISVVKSRKIFHSAPLWTSGVSVYLLATTYIYIRMKLMLTRP